MICTGFCQSEIKIAPRILGGEYAEIADFPWQLSLKYDFFHACGASILSARRALTAAHCYNKAIPVRNYTVTAGSSMKHQSANNNVRVIKFIRHPHYDNHTLQGDIAVLWLEQDLVFSQTVQPVRLPKQNEVVVHGAIAYVSGWGCASTHPSRSTETTRQLRWTALKVVSNKRCNIFYTGDILNDMLCAGSEYYERDSMLGDSGGALVIGNVQIGVVSWGKNIVSGKYPGVYSRVAFYTNWIKSIV